jgi:hypothetical protein
MNGRSQIPIKRIVHADSDGFIKSIFGSLDNHFGAQKIFYENTE